MQLLKTLSLALLLFVTSSCSTILKDKKQMNIINLKNNFQTFWTQAKDKPFDTQVTLWEEHVESKYDDLYSSLVWNKEWRKDWQEYRQEKLKAAFKKYETSYDEIIHNFDNFETTLLSQIKKYKTLFPDADFTKTPIYAMPSIGAFNGKGSSLESNPTQTILVFGIDFITWRKDNPDILYSHELFHIYHIDKMGVNEKVFTEEGKLSLPLWLEGFATWTSGQLNRDKSVSALMMDEKLGKVPTSNVSLISKSFLKDVNKKAFNKKDPSVYKGWFGMGHDPAMKGLPNRLGYYLGYYVLDEISKKHKVEEMVTWNHKEVHKAVNQALEEL